VGKIANKWKCMKRQILNNPTRIQNITLENLTRRIVKSKIDGGALNFLTKSVASVMLVMGVHAAYEINFLFLFYFYPKTLMF